MRKEEVWDEEINPDGINYEIEEYNEGVWDRGYFKRTDDGIWYEVYVNEDVKNDYPDIENDEEMMETLKHFDSIFLDNYNETGQITFFEPYNEGEFTFSELEDIFA